MISHIIWKILFDGDLLKIANMFHIHNPLLRKPIFMLSFVIQLVQFAIIGGAIFPISPFFMIVRIVMLIDFLNEIVNEATLLAAKSD